MNSFKDKYKENERVAYNLKEDGFLNGATNRFYYATFQKLSDYANLNGYEYNDKIGNSHKQLTDFLEEHIKVLMNDSDFDIRVKATQASRAPSLYDKLKKLRIKADYKYENIKEEEIIEMIKNKNDFDTALSFLKNR
ncbi:hypothetical protein [Mammaliicoccus lentus]|nr:hypothetical protein [Mammaliicoccus lentus]MBF0749779.1 hypothetical protein [Mammaliicoccus lentus]TFU57230.1 hypothetical protein E4T93_10185 [Mammaliicoccus lentus]